MRPLSERIQNYGALMLNLGEEVASLESEAAALKADRAVQHVCTHCGYMDTTTYGKELSEEVAAAQVRAEKAEQLARDFKERAFEVDGAVRPFYTLGYGHGLMYEGPNYDDLLARLAALPPAPED
jgi:hypothetical protein